MIRGPRALLLLAALAALPAAGAGSGSAAYSVRGLVEVRATAREAGATALVPEPGRLGIESSARSLTALAALAAWPGPFSLHGQARASLLGSGGEGKARIHVDEFHAEYALTPERFLHAGRRHVVHGHSLGVNPLDVFLDPLDLDPSKNAVRRRSETRGQDLLGFEVLSSARLGVSGYWAPSTGALNRGRPQRALLAAAVALPERKSDLTGLLFEDERPGAGLSLSRSLGDAVVVYADATLRRGRDRQRLRAEPGPGLDILGLGESGGDRWFPRSSVGAGYTHLSDTVLNLEYYFDANGYSSSEWDEIVRRIDENDRARRAGSFDALPAGNLLRLNALLDHFTLRRHYAFLRAWRPGLFGRALSAELTLLHNLADRSGSLGLRFEHEAGPGLSLGLGGHCRYGGGADEFGLRPGRLSGVLFLGLHF